MLPMLPMGAGLRPSNQTRTPIVGAREDGRLLRQRRPWEAGGILGAVFHGRFLRSRGLSGGPTVPALIELLPVDAVNTRIYTKRSVRVSAYVCWQGWASFAEFEARCAKNWRDLDPE